MKKYIDMLQYQNIAYILPCQVLELSKLPFCISSSQSVIKNDVTSLLEVQRFKTGVLHRYKNNIKYTRVSREVTTSRCLLITSSC